MSTSNLTRYIAPLALVPALVFAPLSADASTRFKKAKVLNVQPQYETVTYTVPTESCRIEQVPVYDDGYRYQRRSYTAPIVGAIIGGAVGNTVMNGKTRKRVGTAVGAVLGASIGADISRNRSSRGYHTSSVSYRSEEVCQVVNEIHEEQQLRGYEVKYRYAGETYVTLMDQDPGRFVRVRVDVTPV